MADQGRHLPPQRKTSSDVRDNVEMADTSTGPQGLFTVNTWAWQVSLWLVLGSWIMWLLAGVRLLRALRMSHRLIFFTSPTARAVSLFGCGCWVLVVFVFCVWFPCLHVQDAFFLILIENASRWPTTLNRSFGCAQKKKTCSCDCVLSRSSSLSGRLSPPNWGCCLRHGTGSMSHPYQRPSKGKGKEPSGLTLCRDDCWSAKRF